MEKVMEHGAFDHHSIFINQKSINDGRIVIFYIDIWEGRPLTTSERNCPCVISRAASFFFRKLYSISQQRGADARRKNLNKMRIFLDKRSSLWYPIILSCRILSLSLEGRRDQGQGEQLNNVIRQACKDLSKNTPVRAWKGLPMYCSSETVTYQYGPREAIYSRWIRIDM